MTTSAPAPLSAATDLPLSVERAFDLFTAGFDRWWPREFTWSQAEHLDRMVFGDGPGALLSEIGPFGFRIDWGRITDWQPPHALTFTWQIGADRVPLPDPAQASRVAVTFTEVGRSTRIQVVHDRWEAHGAEAAAYRDGFSEAWPMALAALRTVTSTR